MRVLLVRHGPAGDRAVWALARRDDRLRPLTPEGRKRTKRAFKGLRAILPRLERIATSRFVRAEQTARILHALYPKARFSTLAALAHGAKPAGIDRWLRARGPEECVALVGHEPELGLYLSRLLGAGARPVAALKKPSCALVEFDGRFAPGRGQLQWLLQPKALRSL